MNLLKKLFLLLSVIVLTGCVFFKDSENEIFAVYLKYTGEEIFSENDLQYYDSSANEFVFTDEGALKMKNYQPSIQMNAGLYQKEFSAKLGNEEIYSGKFWSYLSSQSEEGIVMSDVVMVGPQYRKLVVSSGYPQASSNIKINDPRIIDHFTSINKLR